MSKCKKDPQRRERDEYGLILAFKRLGLKEWVLTFLNIDTIFVNNILSKPV